jgi:putative ABC transport system permease protein
VNLATISISYLRARKLSTLLVVVLLALGVGTITLLALVTTQIEQRMRRDAEGFDLVVGAKGSPMQIILSAIYALDVPTGNIPLAQADALAKNRLVKKTIPLALGDSFRGFRIVGAPPDYVDHYGGRLAAGRQYEKPMEVVLGATVARATGLKVGATFAGAHGMEEGGDLHENEPYAVVGVLERTGSVLDRLVVTSVESVWEVHEHAAGPGEGKPGAEPPREITALLVQYASPLAAAMLPRVVNASSGLQAASPAYETARLFSIVGVAIDVLRAFAAVLIVAAGLSVFIALYQALEERRYDLAIMRTLGASARRIMGLLLLEALLLSLLGALAGLALGHLATEVIGALFRSARQVDVTGWIWLPGEALIVAVAVAVGVLAALIPAWRAYRTDIAGTLANG